MLYLWLAWRSVASQLTADRTSTSNLNDGFISPMRTHDYIFDLAGWLAGQRNHKLWFVGTHQE